MQNDGQEDFGLYKVNVHGGRPELLTGKMTDATNWFADHNGEPRGAVKHATKLRRELNRHERSYEWLVKGNEANGFGKEKKRSVNS